MERLYAGASAHRYALLRWRPALAVSLQAFPLISGIQHRHRQPHRQPANMREMLDVAARHGVKATTEAFAMARANEAIEKVKKNKVRYRAVLAN